MGVSAPVFKSIFALHSNEEGLHTPKTLIFMYTGELAALGAAVFWTGTALAFEAAGRRIGSLSLNLIRLLMGLAFLSVYTGLMRGLWWPTDATQHQWIWLSASGLVGFVLGDLLLFQAFVVIGARVSMLLMALAPPFAALISWAWLGEHMRPMQWLGMLLVVSGIATVILKRGEATEGEKRPKNLSVKLPWAGLLLGIGGALGQGGGLVMSKYGMGDFDPFSANQIRALTGIIGFAVVITLARRWGFFARGLRNGKGMLFASMGALMGPFLGVGLSLMAVQHTQAGVAATLMAITPVLIIPPTVLIHKEPVKLSEIIGALITVLGVSLMFV